MEGERTYKFDAKSELDRAAPLARAASGTGFSNDVLAAFQATNLLSPFEKMRVREVLRGPSAEAFVRSAAELAHAPAQNTLRTLEAVLKPYNSAGWAVVTYLPFLWRPDRHMLLKPEVTRDFAARVGHSFADDYTPRLDISVYESLLDLTEATATALAGLAPRDNIDLQSFIWIVGKYEDEAPAPRGPTGARLSSSRSGPCP